LDWGIVVDRISFVFKNTLPGLSFYVTGLFLLAVFVFHVYQLITKKQAGPEEFLFLGLATYCFWFFFIADDGWWRHFYPFALVFLYLFFNMIKTIWDRLPGSNMLWKNGVAAVFVLVFIGFVGKPGASTFVSYFDATHLTAQREFADKVMEYNELGYRFGVWGWWQAPEISFLTGGIPFKDVQTNCGKPYKAKYLIIYSIINERLDPNSAVRLLECAGNLVYSSPDNMYFLYETAPGNK